MRPRILFIIPARKGSKGLPNKNIKPFGKTTLIELAIDNARQCARKDDIICLSTNDELAIDLAERRGIMVPFVRPDNLADDTTSMEKVIRHAMNYYYKKGEVFDCIVLLQPTSPLRSSRDIDAVIELYDGTQEMIVTVNKAKENPYFNIYEESDKGKLIKSKSGKFTNRQSLPNCFTLNGAVYLLPITTLEKKSIHQISMLDKVEIPVTRSIDIDTQDDWDLALYYFNKINEDS